MYDRVTSDLLGTGPPLPGLDRRSLPDGFTAAFAQISAIRIALRQPLDTLPEQLSERVATLQRLACTHEALLTSLPDREERVAAAFIAASAHQLVAIARRRLTTHPQSTYLTAKGISSDIAAMLLFMVAEATPDAAEVSRAIASNANRSVENELIGALRDLGLSRLSSLRQRPIPPLHRFPVHRAAAVASTALYRLILKGVHDLAEDVMADPRARTPASVNRFQEAKSLAILDGALPSTSDQQLVSAFPGPHHLASLLLSVAPVLQRSAVTRLDAPATLDSTGWRRHIRRLASRRPTLWKNHRGAISKGYLKPGVSSAVSFPTGAGKSTLAELKIIATLIARKRVVFLAPTNALVDQTATVLQDSLPDSRVKGKSVDDFLYSPDEDQTPDVLVMTPESCLTQLALNSSAFERTGLLVFDECHLLHGIGLSSDRRAIDAMLCLLNFAVCFPRADFLLLSAMMKNARVVAEWIQSLTGRPCLTLDLSWKPTRQLSGAVVYQRGRINSLADTLQSAREVNPTRQPPLAVKRRLTAVPMALFSLRQTWASRRTLDYSLQRLIAEHVQLGVNRFWRLTPNAVHVTEEIAAAASESGLRVLAFFQSVPNAAKAARTVSDKLGAADLALEEQEKRWIQLAILELGDRDHLYLKYADGRVTTYASSHHGLLLPAERRVCEALFRREGGLKVLAATSTLAQGMNLPCDLVLIGEDSRFDPESNERKILEAQELLNAAGRAGRAGQNAAGVVLVVPGRVVDIDIDKAEIGDRWGTLREIFGQSDQCLEIEDPLRSLLDRVHTRATGIGDIERYAVARLAASGPGETVQEQLSVAIGKTFAAFVTRQRGDDEWLRERTKSAIDYLQSHGEGQGNATLASELAVRFGLSTELVERLSLAVDERPPHETATILDWTRWFFGWLTDNPHLLEGAIRSNHLISLFGKKYTRCPTEEEKANLVLRTLGPVTELWMRGHPLCELEIAFGTAPHLVKTCNKARRFALQVVPHLACLFGLPELLRKGIQVSSESPSPTAQARARLAECTRIGLDSSEKAALRQLQPALSRRETHMRYQQIRPYLVPAAAPEHWEDMLARLERALVLHRRRR